MSRHHIVSDHAVIRYLERVYGVDIDALRKRIAAATLEARAAGAGSAISKGVRYTLAKNGRVTTVMGKGAEMSNRGKRWRARHK